MLLVAGNGDVQVGTPTVGGACVVAEVVEHGRDRKIRVFKYKAKTRYRRRQGHRQGYTRLAIRQIITEGGVASVAETTKPAPARRRKRQDAPATEAAQPEAAATAEPAEAQAETKPRRARTAAKPPAEEKPRRRARAPKATAPEDSGAEAETPGTE